MAPVLLQESALSDDVETPRDPAWPAMRQVRLKEPSAPVRVSTRIAAEPLRLVLCPPQCSLCHGCREVFSMAQSETQAVAER
jgi:hypothetical protein